MQEWGIFNDESEHYGAEQAVESAFFSKEEAETALRERYSVDDECYVHKIEDPDEDDLDDEEDPEYEPGDDRCFA